MLTDKQIERYADVLLWGLYTARKTRFKKNDIIVVRFNLPAVRLAEELQAKLLQKGMNPIIRLLSTPAMERNFYALSTTKQLTFLPPGEKNLLSQINGSIMVYAPESLTHLQDINPRKIAQATVSQKKLRDILIKREAQGTCSWTLGMYPTPALASHAGMSID